MDGLVMDRSRYSTMGYSHAAISIVGVNVDSSQMDEIDAIIDDGEY